MERPTTFTELANAWALRDDQYARLPKPLDDIQIGAVIAGRQRETMFLAPVERGMAWRHASTWYPPVHGQ